MSDALGLGPQPARAAGKPAKAKVSVAQ